MGESTSSENKGKLEIVIANQKAFLGSFEAFQKEFYQKMSEMHKEFMNEIRQTRQYSDTRVEKVEKKIHIIEQEMEAQKEVYSADKNRLLGAFSVISAIIAFIVNKFF